jgi:hypothetical protein
MLHQGVLTIRCTAPPSNFGNYPILAILAISCSPRPVSFSRRPTPHSTFVENKSPTPIRPSGDRAVDAFFLRFSGLQSRSISALFSRFKCSVGRGSQRRTLGLAEYCLLSADCFLSKTPYRIAAPRWEEICDSTICSPMASRENARLSL